MIEFEEAQELIETPLPQGYLIVLKEIQNEYLEPQSITNLHLVSLKRKALIIMKPSLQYLRRIYLG